LGQFIKGEAVYDQALNKVLALQKEIRAMAGKDSRAGQLIYDDKIYRQIEEPVNRLDHALAELQAGRGAGGKFLKDPAQQGVDQAQQNRAENSRQKSFHAEAGHQCGREFQHERIDYDEESAEGQ